MNISYLDKTGLSNVWNKAKSLFANKSDVETELNKKFELPSGGAENDVLTKTASGIVWKSASTSADDSSKGYGTSYIDGDIDSTRIDYMVNVTNTVDRNRGITASYDGTNGSQNYSTFRKVVFSFTETGVYKISLNLTYKDRNAGDDEFDANHIGGTYTSGYRYIIYPRYTKPYALPTILSSASGSTISTGTYEDIFSVTDATQKLTMLMVPAYGDSIGIQYKIIKIANLGGALGTFFTGKYQARNSKDLLEASPLGYYTGSGSKIKFINEFSAGGITASVSGAKLTVNLPSDYLYKMSIAYSTNSDASGTSHDWTINYKFPYDEQKSILFNNSSSWDPSNNSTYTVSYDEYRVNTSGQVLTATLKPLIATAPAPITLRVNITALEKYT